MHVNDFLDAASVVGVAPLLIGAFAKGMIILMVGALCALVARAASAATRHLIWTLSLTGALVAPAIAAIVPRWGIAVPRWLSNETPRLDAVTVSPALSGASSNVVLSLAPRARSTVSVGGTAAVPRRRAVTRTTSSPATAAVLTPERDANLVEVCRIVHCLSDKTNSAQLLLDRSLSIKPSFRLDTTGGAIPNRHSRWLMFRLRRK